MNAFLSLQRLLLKSGASVDATVLNAPSSTQNATRNRDPEMSETRKGNTGYFSMRVHLGTDVRGILHAVTPTTAREADINRLPDLLRGGERSVHGDRGYYRHETIDSLRRRGIRARNRRWSSMRARVEHPLPRDQTAVGTRQGLLPGPKKERGTGVCVVDGAGQPLSRAPPAAATRGA